MSSVPVKPTLLRWACERSRVDDLDLAARFPRFDAWESGEKRPTIKQLGDFARFTHTPIGFFFLPEPPVEHLPIRDLRTVKNRPSHPSAGLDAGWAAELTRWHEALSELRRRIEDLGVMAVVNGIVGNNTSRKLDVTEFRGFALVDSFAPLIFVNGADSESAKMFTLAHELAHLWLGTEGEGLSGFEGIFPTDSRIEKFCDRAAAEFLIPARELRERWPSVRNSTDAFERLARDSKVSPIVAGRRAMDLRLVDRETFFDFYWSYTQRESIRAKPRGGGDFYNNQNTRVGKGFALTVARAALEGRLSFADAYDITGLNGGAFQEYARRLGVPLP